VAPLVVAALLLLALPACDLFGGGAATPTPVPPTRQAAPSATAGAPTTGPAPPTRTGTPAMTPGAPPAGAATPTAPPVAGGPSPTGAVASPPTPAPQEADTAGGPLLSLAVNGGREVTVPAGWPLLARAGLLHPAAMLAGVTPPPLVVGAPGRGWAESVRVVVADERGAAQTWPLHPAQTTTGPLALDATTGGELVWWLTPEETSRLAPGLYTAQAVLETSGAGGWQGRVSSVPVSIRIMAEPATLSPAEESEKQILLASYEWWRNNPNQALAHLDALLATQPGNIEALAFKGDLRDEAGATAEALQLYDQAIDAFTAQNPPDTDPPVDLLLRRRELRDKLINGP
jgi:hypothetical protein